MQARYWIVIVIAALGWGSGGIATRAAFDEGVGPWTMVALRIAIAFLLVLAVLLVQRSPLPSRQVVWYGFVQSVFNLSVPYVLFTFALDEASAGFVALLAALIPISTAVAANFMLPDEPLTAGKLAALLVALTGVAALLLSGDSGLSEGGRPIVALGLGLTSVASIGYAGAFAKKHAGSYEPMMLTGLQFAFAAAWLLVVMFAVEGAPTDLTANGWKLIIFMAVAASFMPFVLFFWLIQYITVTNASLISYMVPFVGLVGGILLLNEQLQPGIVVGGVLVLLGMILSDRAERRSQRTDDEVETVSN